MRAGKLDRIIVVQRFSNAVDDYGQPTMTWSDVASLRAQLVQASTEEFIRGAGAIDETVIVFRTHYLDGVTDADRVSYAGDFFNIKELKEIGRRKGLEIRAVAK